MKTLHLTIFSFLFLISPSLKDNKSANNVKDFYGKATYILKTKMDLGRWGARLTEVQKKQVATRLKNRLQKTYTLTFNKEESFFKENDKLDAISGATDSWGKNFSPGDQYKNVKTNTQEQQQEFYGKAFLVKDKLQAINWDLGSETKTIGSYTCYKATALIPTNELTWYSFSWSKLRNTDENGMNKQEALTKVEAWYSPQLPISHGPLEFWGLPGLILEVSYNNSTLLCSEIILNPSKKLKIKAPKKGTVITKIAYQEIITKKMKEYRETRMGRRRGNRRSR